MAAAATGARAMRMKEAYASLGTQYNPWEVAARVRADSLLAVKSLDFSPARWIDGDRPANQIDVPEKIRITHAVVERAARTQRARGRPIVEGSNCAIGWIASATGLRSGGAGGGTISAEGCIAKWRRDDDCECFWNLHSAP